MKHFPRRRLAPRSVIVPLLGLLLGAPAAPAQSDEPAPAAAAARDELGDPLPAGAVARLGSSRLRHSWRVMGVAFSPDGRTLYSMDNQSEVRAWDASSGELLRSMAGSQPTATSFSLSGDGRRIAISRTTEPATVIDAATGATQLDLEVHGSRASLSPDGRWIAAWGPPFSKVDLLDANGELKLELNERVNQFPAVVFSPDGSLVALVGVHRTESRQYSTVMSVRDTATGETLYSQELSDIPLIDAAFSPDGTRLAAGDGRGGIHVWDARTGKEERTAEGWETSVLGVSWSPDGKFLAETAGASQPPMQGSGIVAFTLRDGSSLDVLREFPGHHSDVTMLAFDPESRRIASSSRDRIVRVWDVATGERLLTPPGHETGVAGIAASADGALIVTAGDDGQIGAWDGRSGARQGLTPAHDRTILSVACSADGRVVASSSADGLLRFGDTRSGETLGGWTSSPATAIYGIAFSPTAPLIACANADGKVRLHDISRVMTGEPVDDDTLRDMSKPLHELDSGGANAFSVAISPDGRWVATGASRLRLYDAASGELAHDVVGTSPILSIAFSPDGKLVAAAFADTKVRLYDAATLAERGTLSGHSNRVKSVAFSSDSRTLASVGETESVIRLWDVERLQPAGELAGHADMVRAVTAVAPDRLASASADGTALVWTLPELPASAAPAASPEPPRR